MELICELYSKGIPIRADDLSKHELEIVRACYDREESSFFVFRGYTFDCDIRHMRSHLEGLALYRRELLPEFYRALGKAIPRDDIDDLLYIERAIENTAHESHLSTLTQFECASASEKELIPNAADIQYFIDTQGIRERLGDEYKLED